MLPARSDACAVGARPKQSVYGKSILQGHVSDHFANGAVPHAAGSSAVLDKVFRLRRNTAAILHPVTPLDDHLLADGKLDFDRVPEALEFSFLAGRRRFINSIAMIYS